VERERAPSFERPHVQWSRGGRVAKDGRGVRRGRLEVRHGEERVRRRLQPDEVDATGRRAGLVELDVAESPAAELAEEDAGAEVGALGERDGPSGLQQREDDRGARGGARGEEHGLAAVELTERPLGLRDRRAPVPRVDERAGLPVLVGPRRRAVEPAGAFHAATLDVDRGILRGCTYGSGR
jgi:hypothetical protein